MSILYFELRECAIYWQQVARNYGIAARVMQSVDLQRNAARAADIARRWTDEALS